MQIFALLPFYSALETNFYPEKRLLTVRWPIIISQASLKAQYEYLLQVAPVRQASRWLLDIRQCPVPNIETANWITLNWLPRAAAMLAPARLCVAYVVSDQRAEALAAPELSANIRDAMAPNRLYHLGVFGTEPEAVRWLLD